MCVREGRGGYIPACETVILPVENSFRAGAYIRLSVCLTASAPLLQRLAGGNVTAARKQDTEWQVTQLKQADVPAYGKEAGQVHAALKDRGLPPTPLGAL